MYNPNWRQEALNQGKDVNSGEFASQRAAEATYNQNKAATDPNELIKKAIEQQQKAAEPAIASYKAQIPEIQGAYAQTRTQLQAKEQPLTDRYNALLESIKSKGEAAVNRQTVVTSNEIGKRGLTGDSTLAQQEILNATEPVRSEYTGLEKDTSFAREEALTALRDQLANLTPQETADTRAITNAIAQLQAGAGQAGITQGMNLYSTNLNAQLQQQQLEQEATQKAIDNAIKQAELANQTKQTNYNVNAPYFKPESGSSSYDLNALMNLLGGGSSKIPAKPNYKPNS